MAKDGLIEGVLERDAASTETIDTPQEGVVATLAGTYTSDADNLLGFVLDMSYDEATIVTCDAWKLKCGGVPKNSFVVIKANPTTLQLADGSAPTLTLILARVTEAVATPLSKDMQQTIFAIHKVQAVVDPYTNAELQWGALKVNILGTYYDSDAGIAFGNDIDSYLSPHFYEVYVPTGDHLETLVNSFVEGERSIKIGRLRYTETELRSPVRPIEVEVAPRDFVANRTALFGKTRMGKSNTIKVILETMLAAPEYLGQVVFDLSGEYTYPDPQSGGSLYLRYQDQCSRFSLKPRRPEIEAQEDVPAPKVLRANFYEQVALGHAIITGLWNSVHPQRADYVAAFLGWEPVDVSGVPERFPEWDDKTRYQRALSMYFAMLNQAGFSAPGDFTVQLHLKAPLKQKLAADPGLSDIAAMKDNSEVKELDETQTLNMATRIYERLWTLYSANPDDASLFPASKNSGKPYFEPVHRALLKMIGDNNVSGARKVTPFKAYHDPSGSDVATEVVSDVLAGKTVLVDLSQADQVVATYYSEMLAGAVLRKQMERFAEMEASEFVKHSVLFYFEEAHNLFRADDKDLTSIYNKLAKEGAKFQIGMVYATQSMTTLSPDLLKNTENFFIAHLNDDREIRELERRYEFRDIGLDVQRSKTKGYVRMITLSHRYALPVQIRLFELSQPEVHEAEGA